MNSINHINALNDNYIWSIACNSHQVIIVDPSEDEPVLTFCKKNHKTIAALLITHHHADHVGGLESLKKQSGCLCYGPPDTRIKGIDCQVNEDDVLRVNDLTIQALFVPGHTQSHFVYYISELHAVFSGDTLFSAGCGRIFEATAEQLNNSLRRIAQLPDDTLVYCGHEYTLDNLLFGQSILPHDHAITQRKQQVELTISNGNPSVPSLIKEEKKSNIFLRTSDKNLRMALDMELATDVEVFTKLRTLKNSF